MHDGTCTWVREGRLSLLLPCSLSSIGGGITLAGIDRQPDGVLDLSPSPQEGEEASSSTTANLTVMSDQGTLVL